MNGSTPAYQQNATSGLYFRADAAHTGGTNRFTPVTVTANSVTTDSWLQYVPPNGESLLYDADGNLTSDGRWYYKWDGENRLIRMDTVTHPGGTSMRLIFAYDGLSRRIRKDVYQNSPLHTITATNGTLTKREHYLYEGWNLVLTAADNGVGTAGSNTGGNITKRVASYVWGPDIGSKPLGRSSWQEAGGVGGLLMVIDGVNSAISYPGVDYNGAAAGNGTAPADPVDDDYIPLMDHLGNVTGLHQLAYGNLGLQGTMDYDAFGREIRSTGPACDKVPFHFSTKFTDPETGLNYYGYRFYDPNNGRWINRDPIGEAGGQNIYCMVSNNLLLSYDILGLRTLGIPGHLRTLGCDQCPGLLASVRYIPEDSNTGALQSIPPPPLNEVQTLAADALYYPGSAMKIADYGSVTLHCDCCNKQIRVVPNIGTTVWKVGEQNPPVDNWPGGQNAPRPYPLMPPPN